VDPVALVLIGWAILAAAMVLLWLLQRQTGDAGVVDLGWTSGLGLLALLYAAGLDEGLAARRWLVAAMVLGWSLRLSLYLLVDRILPRGEDARYGTLRARWGQRAQLRLFVFFQVQALVAALLSIQFMLAMLLPAGSLRVWDLAALGVVLASVLGESLADRQLRRFRHDPANRGRTCRSGLWRYSRHPNYFFEWIFWLAFVVMAWGFPVWPATWLAPALMLYFILRVTGIPPTEEQALQSRGDDYRRYQRETSAFFPWFPRSADGMDR
jgi:steroid 5-alpha reductase family enzyme